jgi:hypothetical protein
MQKTERKSLGSSMDKEFRIATKTFIAIPIILFLYRDYTLGLLILMPSDPHYLYL